MKAELPRNVKQVRQFLGLAGFLRKFIKDFAKKVAPLTNLLRKNIPCEWKQEQENAVREMKEILSSRPILTIFDPSLETDVHTDASSDGLGRMLIQKAGSMKHLVAYYKWKTSPEEQRYHSYDLETLAVVEALKKFRVYVEMQVFIPGTWQLLISANPTDFHLVRNLPAEKIFSLEFVRRQSLP